MPDFEIEQFTCFSDNFGVLVHDPDHGVTASIDAPQAEPILATLERRGWRLTHVFTTHHHHDHVGANEVLKARFGAEITGPEAEKDKIPGIDRTVGDGDRFRFGSFDVDVISTPGHTAGHVTYHVPTAGVAFTGDTLFSLGCGRLFEAGPDVMLGSMKKLAALPPETEFYCGHEYTLSNARFAVTIDPTNAALAERAREVEALRNKGCATLPSTIRLEMATNPFLRWHDVTIRRNLGLEDASDAAVFAEIRRRKDNF